jgi:hypothetical protein
MIKITITKVGVLTMPGNQEYSYKRITRKAPRGKTCDSGVRYPGPGPHHV